MTTEQHQDLSRFGLKDQSVDRDPSPFSMGPRKVYNVICADGVQRTATCSPYGADTFFSIPARVSARGKTVSGYVTRETLQGWSTETEDDPAVWKFVAYTYGKNAGRINDHVPPTTGDSSAMAASAGPDGDGHYNYNA